jgi:negative regulator of replication initiation
MILTLQVPNDLHKKIEIDKQRTGLSKSDIVRQILLTHYRSEKALTNTPI